MLIAKCIALANFEDMGKKKPMESWVSEEARDLSELFKARATLNQGEFGHEFHIGSQGMVSQYLTGRRPLNVAAAIGFARGLDVTISQFSPRLAALIREAAIFNGGATNPDVSDASAEVLRILKPLPQSEQERMADLIKVATRPRH